MKVLIIDDEQAILSMYGDKLNKEGFTVSTATDGEDGFAKAKSLQPDVILLDIILPKVNGFDILKKLKADDATKQIPVYLLSNIPEDSSGDKGKKLGAIGYIFKAETEPADLVKLLNSLKSSS